MSFWTKKEIQTLMDNYPDKGKLWCCHALNRAEGQVRHRASVLGLRQNRDSDFFKGWQRRAASSKIGKKRPEHSKLMSQYMSDGRLYNIGVHESPGQKSKRMTAWHKENHHPKGMLGKTHSDKVKSDLSLRSKKMWADEDSVVNSEEHRQKLSDRQSKNMAKRLTGRDGGNIYSKVKSKTVDIGGNVFFARSSWEANIASYLQFLLENHEIKGWEHEPETFWFEEIKRGVRSYLPDFKVTENNGDIRYIEVKGCMDKKSATKINRMAKYYPEVKLEIISAREYKAIEKSKSLFKFWGAMDSDAVAVRVCEIDKCKGKHRAKGLCGAHYYQKNKKGKLSNEKQSAEF